MNWEILNRLLGMTTVWTAQTMLLILDKEPVPPAAYAPPAPGRDGGTVLQPDPARVQQHLARGATMVLNFIDQLTPELSAFARSMETALGGKVQANLYLSSKRKQGFRAHFDFHDVFAMHVMGEKTWFVFQGRADNPIKHPMFEGWPRERHEQLQGRAVARGQAAARRPALSAARPVPLRPRRRRAMRAHRLGRDLPDRDGRRQLRVRAHGRANPSVGRTCRATAPGSRPGWRRSARAGGAEAGRAAGARRHGARICASFRWPRETL